MKKKYCKNISWQNTCPEKFAVRFSLFNTPTREKHNVSGWTNEKYLELPIFTIKFSKIIFVKRLIYLMKIELTNGITSCCIICAGDLALTNHVLYRMLFL